MGIVAYIMKDSRVAAKLREEIDAAYSSRILERPIPSYQQASKLPYLNACISEGLRLSPAIANIFTRAVPAGGATIMGDDFVPEDTVVGINNWVMGRNKALYGGDAEIFKPERWLDEKQSKILREYEFAFGHGARLLVSP
jgi:cytochrome P450